MHQARNIPRRATQRSSIIRRLVPESIVPVGQKSDEQIAAIQAFYELADATAVIDFLERHAAARRVMAEAIESIPRYFPDYQKVTARYRPNIDAPDFPYVAVRIDTGTAAKAARELRERFDEEWWLAELPSVHGELLIDVEYR
jgi:hypothetical protein